MTPRSRARAEEAIAGLEESLRELRSPSGAREGTRFKAAFELFERFELVSVPLYRVRRGSPPGDAFRLRVEDAVAAASHEVLALRGEGKRAGRSYADWVGRYRALWRAQLALYAQTCFLFAACAYAGGLVATLRPEYSVLLIPHEILESILHKKSWFEAIRDNPLIYGYAIARNNIGVALKSFVGGAVLGLGGIFVLAFNGLHFGAVYGYCRQHGFEAPLRDFVAGHGVLEISVLVASAFAGFVIGRAFYRRPLRELGGRLATAGRDAGVLATGIVPWLVLAAAIEAGFSPWPDYPFEYRLLVGVAAAAAFWGWTFKPGRRPQV